MGDWIARILLDDEEQESPLDASDLASAAAAGAALAESMSATLLGVTLVDPTQALREAGIAKLVSLGLTEDQAKAIAGVPPST